MIKCPACGKSEDIETATMGFIVGPDMNKAKCACGWTGKAYELEVLVYQGGPNEGKPIDHDAADLYISNTGRSPEEFHNGDEAAMEALSATVEVVKTETRLVRLPAEIYDALEDLCGTWLKSKYPATMMSLLPCRSDLLRHGISNFVFRGVVFTRAGTHK